MLDNIFSGLPAIDASCASANEQFVDLLKRKDVRIERIVSTGQSSPPGFWYDQSEGEWVIVLSGEAKLQLADEPSSRHLRAGDFVDIAPHRRHRVEWTSPKCPTVWLAVFYSA